MYLGNFPEGTDASSFAATFSQQGTNENLLFAAQATISVEGSTQHDQILAVTNLRMLQFHTLTRAWFELATADGKAEWTPLSGGYVQLKGVDTTLVVIGVEAQDVLAFEQAIRSTVSLVQNQQADGQHNRLEAGGVSSTSTVSDRLQTLGRKAKDGLDEAKARSEAIRAERNARNQAAHLANAAKEAELALLAGPVTASARFASAWGKSVTIYQNGYVKVGGSTSPLLSISGSDSTATKSALGRGIGAVATFGVNLHGSKLRGQAYLSIGTPQQSHTIHLQSPSPGEVADVHRLVAAGQAAIAAREMRESRIQPVLQTEPLDLTNQIQQLVDLHSSGALSDEEFAAAKSKLLGEI